jgi:hypothetical protein
VGYNLEDAVQLNDAVLIPKGDSLFLTKNFQDFIPAPGQYSYLGQFSLNDTTYLVTREHLKVNPKYIIRLKETLEFDTVLTFNGDGAGLFELINANNQFAFFMLDKRLYRYNHLLKNIQQILPGQAGSNFLERRQTVFFGNTLYACDTNLYVLRETDSMFRSTGVDNLNNYPRLSYHPRMKVPWGILCTFLDESDSLVYTGLTDGDTIVHINPLSQWPDSSFRSVKSSLGTYKSGFRDTLRYNYARAIGLKEDANWKDTYQYRWHYFDTISYRIKLTQSVNNSHHIIWHLKEPLFKIGDNVLAFSFLSKHGYELTSLTPQGATLIEDVFPGMASGLENEFPGESYLNDNKQLFFTATHPYHGRSLFRTNGTTEGTGILAAPGLLQGWGQLKMFLIADDLFVYKMAETGVIYRIKKDAPFIAKKHSQPTNKHWNQSINASMYSLGNSATKLNRTRMKVSGGLLSAFTSMTSSNYRFFPEAMQRTPYHRRDFYSLGMGYGVWDTTGQLLVAGRVNSRVTYPQVSVGKDSTVLLFYGHRDSSFTNFDTLYKNGQFHLLRSYKLDGRVQWSREFPMNMNAFDMITDKQGNIYLLGAYSDGLLDLADRTLTSSYETQGYAIKLTNQGELVWAANLADAEIRRLNTLFTLHFDENTNKLYAVYGEGSFNISSSCKYTPKWLTLVSQIDGNSGSLVWKHLIENTDLSEYYGLSTAPNGDVWVAGKFRGEYVSNGEILQQSEGNTNCPTSGLLICIDGKTGAYKRSITRTAGEFADIRIANNNIYTVWLSTERYIESGIDYPDRYHALAIEKRALDGGIISKYESPVSWLPREQPFFDLTILDENENFLLFSSNTSSFLISDSLYIPNRSTVSSNGSCLIMRRPGSFLRKVNLAPTNTFDSNNPFSIYPNPARFNEVFVRAAGNEKPFTRYQLSDLGGRVVAMGKLDEEKFPQYLSFPRHLKGMFLLNLAGNGESQSFKLKLD